MNEIGLITSLVLAILGIGGTILGYFRGMNTSKKKSLAEAEKRGEAKKTLEYIVEKIDLLVNCSNNQSEETKNHRAVCEKRFDAMERALVRVVASVRYAHRRMNDKWGLRSESDEVDNR